MKTSQIFLIVYGSIAMLWTVYQTFFGVAAYKGFLFHLTRGCIWPLVMFPVLGQIVGGLILVSVIGYLLYGRD